MRALLVSSVLLVTGCTTIQDYDQDPLDEPIVTGPTVPTVPQADCNQYEFKGETYNCSQLDRCTEQDFQYRLACCDCDPTLCDPDPDCEDPEVPPPTGGAESCMVCHNGSNNNDYAGTGMSNPHPFSGAAYIKCTTCHGGNGAGTSKSTSHVPNPPWIGDDENLQVNAEAYFNFLTRSGLDKHDDYTVDGQTYSPYDYIQFMNPGDIRVVDKGRGCGNAGCHGDTHADWVAKGPIATEMGFWSNSLYSIGAENKVDRNNDWYNDTMADVAFRAVEDSTFVYDPDNIGRAQRLIEAPEYAQYGDLSGFYQNPEFDANTIANFRFTAAENQGTKTNRVRPGSPLEKVAIEAITFQCGDCHLGSAGANNRYGDFRSAGCTACHMRYSLDGRSRSTDPNVNKLEPVNPDAIAAPERSHVATHQIANVAKVLSNGAFIQGISDNACVGCHQGSNRTVLQFWGIRLDQNQDLVNNFQYPDNPNTFVNTAQDTRLYDPAVANNTFNGRNANQYILYEDYDNDTLDDTPPDVHYEAGMGCIDCHGSRDLHNGTKRTDGTIDPTSGQIMSRMGQMVMVECESCHGDDKGYAYTTSCTDYTGNTKECVVDKAGNPIRSTYKDAQGYWLISRLTGDRHFIPQTLDTIVPNNKTNPTQGGRLIYSPIASYAMGVADGNPNTGVGPMQTDPNLYNSGFTHMDNLACDSCHASWNVNCIGCHIQLAYNANPANYFFSNVTGERITVQVTNADFTYITPVWMGIEVNQRGEIGSAQPGMKAFWRYLDLNNNLADGIVFSDRNGNGNNPNIGGRGAFPALSHNRIYAHSIRGRQTQQYEGTRQCVTCHINQDQLNNYADYPVFFDILENRDYQAYADNNYFELLQTEIGHNTGNQLNNPYFPHMVSGLGTGLLQFDADGCPNNPLDNNANRQYCPNGAPAANFDPNNTVYDLDKTVELNGVSNTSHTQPLLEQSQYPMRTGSIDPYLAGPIGSLLLYKLAHYDANQGALILDSYVDADGNARGGAANFIVQ
ncbi:MAG: hypothetical protein H6735_06615 [Alphaproteobacteria bacterium]|nr:hypothetical protein [Alphaproteobacteria bacterium]